jgi:moderate conductance mechanosensitive channel
MPPTPAPSPTPTASVLSPSKGIAEDILETIGLENISHKPLVLMCVQVALIVLLYLLLRLLLLSLLDKTMRAMATRAENVGNNAHALKLRTLAKIADTLLRWTLAFCFFVSFFSLLGVNVAAILGTASVAGLAFGFGAQKLVKDVITGFFLLLEDQYIVGDYVTIGTVSGTVEELGMRVTKIRDDEGKLHTLSNGDIIQVCNHARGPVLGSFEVGVAPATDLETAMNVVKGALKHVHLDPTLIVEAPQLLGVSGSDAAKINLKIVFKVAPGQRPAPTVLILREAIIRALKEASITLG